MKETLSDKLKAEAIRHGLCEQWQKEWRDDSSKAELCEKFIKGIDFCIKHNYPDVATIRENIDDTLHNHGIYCDEECEVGGSIYTVLNGCCKAKSEIKDCVREFYVRHTSELTIDVTGNSRVWISLYDDARVIVRCMDDSKVFVHNYNNCNALYSGNVSIRNKK